MTKKELKILEDYIEKYGLEGASHRAYELNEQNKILYEIHSKDGNKKKAKGVLKTIKYNEKFISELSNRINKKDECN